MNAQHKKIFIYSEGAAASNPFDKLNRIKSKALLKTSSTTLTKLDTG